MALLSYYDIGFASVANGSTAVTGTSTQWLTALRENDVFVGADGRTARIASIESATALTLARPWPGDSQTDDAYEVRITPTPSEITASVRELLEKLRQGLWLTPNATGTLAERAGYDSARRGFIYMQTDVDPFVVFVKQTDTLGDWSPGFSPQQGPSGPFTTIEIGTTTTLDPGAEATISPVQNGDIVTLNFGIPAGTIIEAGTTTTLAPDQPASVDFDPIPGGFALNFNIPRGPTGDINGVTPFWNTRLGADANAGAALTGLGGTAIGKSLFTAADVATVQNALGLTPQSSSSDATVDRLLKVGAFGLGGRSISLASPDLNADRPNGFYYCSTPTNGPAGAGNGWLLNESIDADYGIQRYVSLSNTEYRRLRYGNVWTPWRATVERGSNAAGEYVRFEDGTQICSLTGTVNASIGIAYGPLFIGTRQWTFPAAFAAGTVPVSKVPRATWATGASWGSCSTTQSNTVANYYFYDIEARATGSVTVSYEATGRWY